VATAGRVFANTKYVVKHVEEGRIADPSSSHRNIISDRGALHDNRDSLFPNWEVCILKHSQSRLTSHGIHDDAGKPVPGRDHVIRKPVLTDTLSWLLLDERSTTPGSSHIADQGRRRRRLVVFAEK
jgi:hypothetical protein